MAPKEFVSPPDQGIPAGNDLLWAGSHYVDQFEAPSVHVHRGFEFGVLLKGEVEILFDRTAVSCTPGDVWLSNVFEPHGLRLMKPPANHIAWVFLPDFVGHEMLGELPWPTLFAVAPENRPRVCSPELRARVLMLTRLLRHEIEGRPRGWEHAARLGLLYLLLELSRVWPESDRPKGAGRVSLSAMTRLMPALSLTHSLPWRKVIVVEAAESCGLSRSRFQELFRATMGMSFGSFALRARLSFVAHRVVSTDRPVAAIANEAGFVDGSHLDHRFATHFGCTPREYRRRARSQSAA